MIFKPIFRGKVRRGVALFLLFTITNQIAVPNIAYALTAGPTAPEATSFEPVDTTDMVNPSTGDFTYSLPLLEVPGPEGGYPLALAYHAAIQPNEEASWVGLGWSLNPGAIARNVNGYPDDWQNQNAVTRSYWSGGHTSVTSIGLNVSLGGYVATVSAGLSFAQDTYKGFGVGYSLGASVGGGQSPFALGVQVGVSPYGGLYAGANLSITGGYSQGMFALGSSLNIGASTNAGFEVSQSFGIGAGPLDASISSAGGGVHLSVGGASAISSVNNANIGKISTQSSGWSFTIPTPFVSFSIGQYEKRYWSDESATAYANGVLYNHTSINHTADMDNTQDDNYSLIDVAHTNIVDDPDPSDQAGGTFPEFDNYSVTAQGLSGYMRPYIFSTAVFNQNRINNSDHSKDIKAAALTQLPASYNTKWQFRFINDFSNSYTQESPFSSSSYSLLHYDFGAISHGNQDGNYGYDPGTNRLEGSKHIEYFTNADIISGAAAAKGFINCGSSAAGFTRPNNTQIGGFMITNASGVTYHYALPAYESDEEMYSERIDKSNGLFYNDLRKTGTYAYTWYLTAITGPDYVPRGDVGTLNKGDWGYWVKFDYGKWTDHYNWRNPSEGTNADIDNQFTNFSAGSKEVYYLDAIETRTHTAIFEKELRADGKSLVSRASQQNQDPAFINVNANPCNFPKASLRLKSVILFQNDQMLKDVATIRGLGNGTSNAYTFSNSCNPVTAVHHGENIIDVNDIIPGLTSSCLKRIVFTHDYSMTPKTPNSYDQSGGNTYTNNPVIPVAFSGRLTLKSVDFQGKGGVSLIPAVKFDYDLDPSDPLNQGTISVAASASDEPFTNQPGTIRISNGTNFSAGDILRFNINGRDYYCLLKTTPDNGATYNVLFLNNVPMEAGNNITAYKTKNPPYNKDAFDLWGCYKSDYIKSSNENLSRITTPLSNKSTDVWSLRKITSSLGSAIKIDYEGDTYNRSVLNHNRSLIISNIVRNGPYSYTMTLNTEGLDLSTIYRSGDEISMLYGARYGGFGYVRNTDSTRQIPPSKRAIITDPNIIAHWYSAKPVITSVSANQVTVTVGGTDEENIYGYNAQNHNPELNFRAGNMLVNGSTLYNGGGLRVKSIIVDDLDGHINKTSYDYSLPGYAAGKASSSGVTTYEPLVFDVDDLPGFSPEEIKDYRRELYKNHSNLLAIAREVPSPGVMYEYVTVKDAVVLPSGQQVDVDGKTMYQFEIFRPEMIGIKTYNYTKDSDQTGSQLLDGNNSVSVAKAMKNNIGLKDYTSRIGNLRRIITYDNLGNKLSEKINHYLHDDLNDQPFDHQISDYEPRLATYANQGVIQERYGSERLVADNGAYDVKYVMSNKETYPAIQTGTTQIDYKNGTRTEQSVLGFDFYSGLVTKSLTKDSYGNRFLNQVTPAYRAGNGTNLAYIALGLKTHDVAGDLHKHMLTQEAANYSFTVDANNNPLGVVAASVQTWSNQIPVIVPDFPNYSPSGQAEVWRQQYTLNWMPTGSSVNNITPIANFQDYFASGGNTNPAWKITNEITRYDTYSKALEGNDINHIPSAKHMGYNSSRVLMTGSPALYDELAFSGAEDPLLFNGTIFSGRIMPGSSLVVNDPNYAHSGSHSLLVFANSTGFSYTMLNPAAKSYAVTVWVRSSDGNNNFNQGSLFYQVNSGAIVSPAQTFSKSAGGWYLLEMTIPASAVTGGNLLIGCQNNSSSPMYFDDFRVQPLTATTNAYVYDNISGELTYALDNNNLFTRYEYDAIGRLINVYKEVLGKTSAPKVKSFSYNYSRNGSGN